MATAKKLPSGQWRVLAYDYTDENKKRHYKSFTAPTKKEAEYMAVEYALTKKEAKKEVLTFGQALDLYIDSKMNVLSESTITGYKNIKKNRMQSILDVPLSDFTRSSVQAWVNSISKDISVKTIKNAYGLFSAVMLMYADQRFSVQFPQKIIEDIYIPSDDDVKMLLKHSEGDFKLALYLGVFAGLRRGEICALERSDVHDGYVTINKSMGLALDRTWKIKVPKTISSNRDVNIPDFLVDILKKKKGRIVEMTPDQVTEQFCVLRDKLQMKKFRFHDLRHYYVSVNHALGVPDQYIMRMGGWSTDRTMKAVYRNTLVPERDKFAKMSLSHFENMQHEMQHEKEKPQ
jgi:integrase